MLCIKDITKKGRGDQYSGRLFRIGPRKKIETNIQELLRIPGFKEELLRFLFVEFGDQIYAPIIGYKALCSKLLKFVNKKAICMDL